MRLPISVTAAFIGAGLLALSAPATAAPISASKNLSQPQTSENSLVVQVQRRRPPRGGYYRGRSYRGGYYRGNDGAGVAAGILGGLLLGSIIANQGYQYRSVDYCAQRYRSYDPYSQTYMGYDGRRHSCP
jgi:hypothetical protein